MNAAPPPEIDVQTLMAEIRGRVRLENQRERTALRNVRKIVPPDLMARVSRLQIRVAAIRASAALIGEPPPAPPTFRARAGAVAVRVLRRALFWLIPGLQAAQEQIAAALEDQTKALEDLVKAIEKTNARMEFLLGERVSGGDSPTGAPGV
jgi:flagellar hook-basal body complex protein FliE